MYHRASCLVLIKMQLSGISSAEEHRRALSLFNDVPLRTRRALLPLPLHSDSALLVFNGTLLNSNNALLALH